MANDLLLEIGTEEIPARFMPGALNDLERKTKAMLEKERIPHGEVVVCGTPRRLTVFVKSLADMGEPLVEERKGPSKKVAFDADEKPTKAAQGFAKGQQVDVEQLVVKDDYVYALIKKEGAHIQELFPRLIPILVLGLEFPKPMRWSYSTIRFVRPIRWLVCLYGETLIPIEIGGINSDRVTYGHRFLGEKQIHLAKAQNYFSTLKENYVLVDQNERRDVIWDQITSLALKEGGQVKPDKQLLEEINYLLEYPTALCGTFAASYLDLPEESLITVMKEHQKYFPVWDKQGRLMNRFITVRNGNSDYIEIVKEGNEKVLEARLSDGKFFFDEDVKKPLAEGAEKLKTVIFQEDLGTMYEKVNRVQRLVSELNRMFFVPETEKEIALRAAYLAKADLVSNMVYEFPELQGIMGYYYARYQGEKEAVAVAIREHYLPRQAGGVLPDTLAGTIVSIADKIDTICGCFAVGLRPSGSGDPYALRRQAHGVCSMMLERQAKFSISEILTASMNTYKNQGIAFNYEESISALKDFFKQRVATLMEENQVSYDVIQCVLEAEWEEVHTVVQKSKAIMHFKEEPRFGELIIAYSRAANLAKEGSVFDIHEDLFVEEAEKKLYNHFLDVQKRGEIMWKKEEYENILQLFAELKPTIDEFFTTVMVMDKQEEIKNNRLGMLRMIVKYLAPFGDLAKLNHK